MLATRCDHFEMVTESLLGKRAVDEETFSSIAELSERLEKLKEDSSLFADVEFSPYVEELASCEMMLAIS